MLKPAGMQKVRIIGLKRDEAAVIRSLHEKGIIELRDVAADFLEKGKPLSEYDVISQQLVRMRGLRASMVPDGKPKPEKIGLQEALAECVKLRIDDELRGLHSRREGIVKRLGGLLEEHKSLSELSLLGVDFSRLRSNRLDFYLGRVGVENYAKLRLELGKCAKDFSLLKAPAKGKFLCLVACRKGADLRKAFDASGFAEIPIPQLTGKVSEREKGLEKEGAALKKELDSVDERIFALSEKYHPKVLVLEEALSIEADRAVAASRFGTTREAFVLEGWLLKKKVAELSHMIEKNFDGKAVMQEIEGAEMPPTVLDNPKIAGPFEFLVEFFSLPTAREIDPSLVLLFTFPIIYGMMVGDVIYGLISLLMAGAIIIKTKPGLLQGFAKLWAYASVPSMLFGIFFDEWMGFKFEHLMELFGYEVHGTFIKTLFGLDFGMSRLENVTELLLLTIVTGMLHLSLGLIFGFINERKHSMTHALAKLAWIGVLWSGLVLVGGLLFKAFAFELIAAAAVVFLISVALIVRADGIIGIFEIPGIAGNALSYARIAAVGIAGLIPAEFVINRLLLPDPHAGLFMFLLLLPIFIAVHAFNVFLAMFESLVQGARLNMVEFYGKFFHGGGKRFAPFSVRRVYTK